uniref:Uncharacterized protein n=1 Tax=Anguilla anguilla TaxID=7936 RepID=A0A0E9Y1I8_ANGAN
MYLKIYIHFQIQIHICISPRSDHYTMAITLKVCCLLQPV